MRRLQPEDLPSGVTTHRGFSPQGACFVFKHDFLGELGQIIVIDAPNNKSLVNAEFFNDNTNDSNFDKRQEVFRQVVNIIDAALNENFPD